MNFNISKTFKRLFSFHRREKEIQSEKTVIQKDKVDTKKPVLNGSGGHKVSNGPAWWVQLVGVKTRAEVGSLHRHYLKTFGNFSPTNGFKKTGKPVEIRTRGKYSLPFRPLGEGPYNRNLNSN